MRWPWRSGEAVHQEPNVRSRSWLPRAALVLLGVLLAVAAADLALRNRTPHFAASSRLVVTPLSRDNDTLVGLPLLRDLGDPIRTIETAAAVVQTPDVATRASRQLPGGWSRSRVQSAVDVAPLAQTNVLEVRATTTSPELSAQVANAYARAILALRREDLARAAESEITATQAQLTEPSISRSTTAGVLRERISELQLLVGTGDPTIALAQNALPPQSPADTPRWMILAFAGLAALVLQGAALLLRASSRPPTTVFAPSVAPAPPAPTAASEATALTRVSPTRAHASRMPH